MRATNAQEFLHGHQRVFETGGGWTAPVAKASWQEEVIDNGTGANIVMILVFNDGSEIVIRNGEASEA